MLKTKPFPLPLFPHTPTPDRWKRSLYSLLSYRYFFFKSAGLHSFPCDLLPPLHIFILSLLCKAFKYVLTPGLSVHYSCINMCSTFILLHQTWDSLCLISSFFLSPHPPKNIVLCSVSGFCFFSWVWGLVLFGWLVVL